jgi:hypothetical protein
MKNWIKSKTMWVGFGVGLLGLIQATLETSPLDPQYQGLITGGIGVAMMGLRVITTKPLAEK